MLSIFFSEPDSPPENLSVVETSPSTATLTWSAPEKANGVIQYYEVFYENESYSAIVNTTSNRVTLMSLKPFSFYNVTVRAYTRYGNGNQTSETLYLLSGEDGVLNDVEWYFRTLNLATFWLMILNVDAFIMILFNRPKKKEIHWKFVYIFLC